MPVKLELLAPARNKDIGIAAIDCERFLLSRAN